MSDNSSNSSKNSFRRGNNVIAEKTPELRAQKRHEEAQESQKALIDSQAELARVLRSQGGSDGLSLAELQDINQNTQESALSGIDTQEGIQRVNESVQELIDIQRELMELQTAESPDTLSNDVLKKIDESQESLKDWLQSALKEAPPKEAPQKLTPEAPVAPKEPSQSDTLSQREDKRERKEDNSAVLKKLSELNSNIKGITNSLTNILLQTSLQAIKMAALAVAGILALDVLLRLAKHFYAKYETELKAFWEGTKKFMSTAWEGIKDIANEVKELAPKVGQAVLDFFEQSSIKEGFNALKDLYEDIKGGNFLAGIGNYMSKAVQVFENQMSRVVESILRAMNFTDTADEVQRQRAQNQIDRGVMPDAEDLHAWSRNQTKETSIEKLKREAKLAETVLETAKTRNIQLPKNILGLTKGDSEEYKTLEKEILVQSPELGVKKELNTTEINSLIKKNAVRTAVSQVNNNPTASEIQNLSQAITEYKSVGGDTHEAETVLHEATEKREVTLQQKETSRQEAIKFKQQVQGMPEKPKTPQAPVLQQGATQVNNINQVANNQTMIAPGVKSLPGFTAY